MTLISLEIMAERWIAEGRSGPDAPTKLGKEARAPMPALRLPFQRCLPPLTEQNAAIEAMLKPLGRDGSKTHYTGPA
jgi:hypothetical protein